MNYIKFETNSLSALVENMEGTNIWEKVGSSPRMIKLSKIDNAKYNEATGTTAYVLPLVDENQFNAFQTECDTLGIETSIITEQEALDYLETLKPIA